MHFPFTPNHVQLISACYPPSATLVTPNVSPNTQELSRLTYYAANKSGKLNKLGAEMEKRVKSECRKAQSGNVRARASLLISLQILRSLATECRRDLSLLTPSLLSSVDTTLRVLPSDLEVSAKAATLFTSWTTYTDGRLIGVDQGTTKHYMSILERFSVMSVEQSSSLDDEFRNRTRLVGLAAITSTINSDVLHSSNMFRQQVNVIMSALLFNIFNASIEILEQQAGNEKGNPASPYFAEFRARPPNERRAASIHVHIDGERGPSVTDLVDACLIALQSLFSQSTASQISSIIQATIETINEQKQWDKIGHCCWLMTKATEWTQYRFRYAVPTKLVERLVEDQDAAVTTHVQTCLAATIASVFTSPHHLVNLSTSDIVSNLITITLRRVAINHADDLLSALVKCIASLGFHVYYSDQIQDLAGELISRLLTVDANGVPGTSQEAAAESRIYAMRYLLSALVGLLAASGRYGSLKETNGMTSGISATRLSSDSQERGSVDNVSRLSRRSKLAPETWQDTLHLLGDESYAIRSDYTYALSFFIRSEISRSGEHPAVSHAQIYNSSRFCFTDEKSRFLHALHVHLFILVTATSFGSSIPTLDQVSALSSELTPPDTNAVINIVPATPLETPKQTPPAVDRDSPHGRPSASISINVRARRQSALKQLLPRSLPKLSAQQPPVSSASDYKNVLDLLLVEFEHLPARAIICGVPFLVALDSYTRNVDAGGSINGHILCLREVLARTWLSIGRIWECIELVQMAEHAISTIPNLTTLPSSSSGPIETDSLLSFDGVIPVPSSDDDWSGVDAFAAVNALLENALVQSALRIDRDILEEYLRTSWSPQQAWSNSMECQSNLDPLRGDGSSTRLRLSPGLMQIENMSLQSLSRSTRGVGVGDLRDALEGRGSMSNPNLAKPPSISTLEHASTTEDMLHRLASTRLQPERPKLRGDAKDVREVLNKLRIGKSNDTRNALLKASFPSLQKPEARSSTLLPPYKS